MMLKIELFFGVLPLTYRCFMVLCTESETELKCTYTMRCSGTATKITTATAKCHSPLFGGYHSSVRAANIKTQENEF